jgi:hypothetical protein
MACRSRHQIASVYQIQIGCDDHGFNVQDQDLGIISDGLLGFGFGPVIDVPLIVKIPYQSWLA